MTEPCEGSPEQDEKIRLPLDVLVLIFGFVPIKGKSILDVEREAATCGTAARILNQTIIQDVKDVFRMMKSVISSEAVLRDAFCSSRMVQNKGVFEEYLKLPFIDNRPASLVFVGSVFKIVTFGGSGEALKKGREVACQTVYFPTVPPYITYPIWDWYNKRKAGKAGKAGSEESAKKRARNEHE